MTDECALLLHPMSKLTESDGDVLLWKRTHSGRWECIGTTAADIADFAHRGDAHLYRWSVVPEVFE